MNRILKILTVSFPLLIAAVSSEEVLTSVSTDTWGVMSQGKMACFDYHYATSSLYWAQVSLVTLATKAKTVAVPSDNSMPYYITYGYANNRLVYVPYLASGTPGSGGGAGSGGRTCYLYEKNISTNVTRQLTTNSSWKEAVWVGGNYAIWVDYRYWDSTSVDSLNSEIFMYDLSANQERRITNDHAYQGKPFTDGSSIVWIDNAQSFGRLFSYTPVTSSGIEIAPFSAGKDDPRIDGNVAVWVDYRNATVDHKNGDIYSYNLTNGVTTPICIASKYQGNPFVRGNWIVWEDFRNATSTDSTNADIYGYNTVSGTTVPLVVAPGYQGHPTLHSDTLCWFDKSGTSMTLKIAPMSLFTDVRDVKNLIPSIRRTALSPTLTRSSLAMGAMTGLLGAMVRIHTPDGKLLLQMPVEHNTTSINFSKPIVKGMYVVTISNNLDVFTFKNRVIR